MSVVALHDRERVDHLEALVGRGEHPRVPHAQGERQALVRVGPGRIHEDLLRGPVALHLRQ
eukprot:10858650-Lingulodinium_polyedra.AAC.1